MAVTITRSPQKYTPSDSPTWWEFSSDQTAQPNFSFIVDLYVGGVLNSRHQIYPENGIYAHFDVSETMQSLCSPPSLNTTSIVQDAQNWNSCYLIVNEYYGSTPELEANNTTDTIYTFKSCIPNSAIDSWDYTDYEFGASDRLFFNEFNRDNISLYSGQTQYLSIITDLTATTLRIRYYDSDDVLLSVDTEAIADTIRIALISLNSGTYLNEGFFNASSYILVDIYDGGELSETIRLNVEVRNDCDIYTRVTWLNSLGGFDGYTFEFNKTQRADITAFSFERQSGQWSGTSFIHDTSVSGTNQYFKTIKDGGQLVSGWINEETQNSLVKLYESPLYAMEVEELSFYNFTIINSSYDIKQLRFEDLFNEIVDFRMSEQRKSPRT